MGDTRTDTALSTIWFKALDSNPPTPPSWYSGTPIFGYGTNPNFDESLRHTPLSHTFSSPFTDGDDIDSYFSRTQVTRDVRGEVGTRDWSDLKTHPPTDLFKKILILNNAMREMILSKQDLGFCIWHSVVHASWYGTGETHPCNLLQIDVASGGKILTKQDFKFRVAPWRYSSNFNQYIYPCFGGFSLHEVYGEELTDAESYEKVAKRVVVLWGDVNPLEQLPRITNQDVSYELATDMTKQPEVTSLGNYWFNFCDTLWAYGSNASSLPKLVYPTNGGWRQCLLFVGEFSLKQLHDYITDTAKFAIPLNGSYPSGRDFTTDYGLPYAMRTAAPTSGSNAYGLANSTKQRGGYGTLSKTLYDVDAHNMYGWLYEWNNQQLHKTDPAYSPDAKVNSKLDLCHFVRDGAGIPRRIEGVQYTEGSFYTQVKDLKPGKLVKNGAPLTPPVTPTGLFSYEYFGAVKITAHTYDGAAPTPYKPVYLLERDTGRLIRSTTSDKNGKYVLHGVPDGVEYIAVSIDPTKTYSSTVEDFGEVKE